MKICILVASLLSLGASDLPEAEESITVGGTPTRGETCPGESLKMCSPCVSWRSDATANRGLAGGLGRPAAPVDATVEAAMIVIHAMADNTSASRDQVTAYASLPQVKETCMVHCSTENFHGSAFREYTRSYHKIGNLESLEWNASHDLRRT